MFGMIGQYEIIRDGDVIRVWSSSEFNLEAAQHYARNMASMIELMPSKFGTLVAFDSPPILAPEVEEAMHASAIQRARRGMVAVAFVTQNIEGIHIAHTQWNRIYESTDVALQFFQEAEPARQWLQACIDQKRMAE